MREGTGVLAQASTLYSSLVRRRRRLAGWVGVCAVRCGARDGTTAVSVVSLSRSLLRTAEYSTCRALVKFNTARRLSAVIRKLTSGPLLHAARAPISRRSRCRAMYTVHMQVARPSARTASHILFKTLRHCENSHSNLVCFDFARLVIAVAGNAWVYSMTSLSLAGTVGNELLRAAVAGAPSSATPWLPFSSHCDLPCEPFSHRHLASKKT